MFDIITNRKIIVPRNSMYCVWVRAHEGANPPLISVWIDPTMTMFEGYAKVQDDDAAAAWPGTESAVVEEGDS